MGDRVCLPHGRGSRSACPSPQDYPCYCLGGLRDRSGTEGGMSHNSAALCTISNVCSLVHHQQQCAQSCAPSAMCAVLCICHHQQCMQSHAPSAMCAVSYMINDACKLGMPFLKGVQSHAPFAMCGVSNTSMLCVVTDHTA